jgi:hypothetical protein
MNRETVDEGTVRNGDALCAVDAPSSCGKKAVFSQDLIFLVFHQADSVMHVVIYVCTSL